MLLLRGQAEIVAKADVGGGAATSKAAPRRRTPSGFALGIGGAAIFVIAMAIGAFAAAGPPDSASADSGNGSAAARLKLGATRTSPSDLEVGVSSHVTRFLTREQLLALPQVTYTVTNDANFHGPAQISGVALEELIRRIAVAPASDLAIAICSDNYHATYPRAYIAAHHPVLVLKVDGHGPEGWPKGVAGNNVDMGPYLISSPDFDPSFKNSFVLRRAANSLGCRAVGVSKRSRRFRRDRASRAAREVPGSARRLSHRAAKLPSLPRDGPLRWNKGGTAMGRSLTLGYDKTRLLRGLCSRPQIEKS